MQKLKLKKEYQKYPEYKDSGIEWLGKIPENWEGIKLKFVTEKIVGGGTPDTGNSKYWADGIETGYPWVAIADITKSEKITKTRKFITEEGLKNSSASLIDPNKVLYSIYASLGKVALSEKQLTTNQAILAIYEKLESLDYKFLFWLMKSAEKFITTYGSANTQNNISLDVLKNIPISLPLKNDQRKIVEFLDEKTELIDKIVKKKKQLIELLKEKRTAIINQAVNSESKDKMQRLKFSIEINPSKQEIKLFPDDYLVSFLPMEKVSNKGKINLEEERKLENVNEGFTYFKNKDVIFAKITPCFENGKGALVDKLKNGIGFGSTEFIVLRANKDTDPGYIFYLISSHKFRKIGEVEMRGSAGQKRVPESFARNYIFNKISFEKQKKITKNLDNKMEELDNVAKKVLGSINLLNEFKSSLISNVVTGKVRI